MLQKFVATMALPDRRPRERCPRPAVGLRACHSRKTPRILFVAVTVVLTAAPACAADVIRADQLKLTLQQSVQKALEGQQVNNVNVGDHIFHIFPISKSGSVKDPKGFSANGTIQHRVRGGEMRG